MGRRSGVSTPTPETDVSVEEPETDESTTDQPETDVSDKEPETDKPDFQAAIDQAWTNAIDSGEGPTGAIPGVSVQAWKAAVKDIPRKLLKKHASRTVQANVSDPVKLGSSAQLLAETDGLDPVAGQSSTRDPRDIHAERVALLTVAVDAAVAEAGTDHDAARVEAITSGDASPALTAKLARIMKAAPVSSRRAGRRDPNNQLIAGLAAVDASTRSVKLGDVAKTSTDSYPDGDCSPGAISDALVKQGRKAGNVPVPAGWKLTLTPSGAVSGFERV